MNIVQELIRGMSLWRPQRESLEVLDRIMTATPIGRGITKRQTLGAMMVAEPPASYAIQQGQFNFQEEINSKIGTEFPSFCFAIATGGGKTRLMGTCIAYLYKTKGFKNFFILSKGETIYNKHRFDDFCPASPKYVFKGLAGFPTPRLIDGDTYERSAYPELFADDITLYLFNIEKIFNERTDIEFRFHRFHENIGGSFADVLRSKPDLVFLMDESHNVRAEKSLRAVNALKPILGLEFTATPKAANVIYAYPLREATRDGLVKRARVIARRDDDSLIEEREDIKLRDGIRIHERKKAALQTYCNNNQLPVVKPRILICAPPSKKEQEQKHIERIAEYVQSNDFLGGAYKGKVLTVHQGSDDQQIQQLLELEKTDNNIEIVIHVNKLKEGWDVKTIYTIIPLRASVSDTLTVQTIGRGLRLPFGRHVSRDPGLSDEERKELLDIDTLDIISHEKYSAVLANVKANPDWDVSVASGPDEDRESRQIDPDGAEEYLLKIPVVIGKPHSEEEIDLTDVKVRYQRFENLDVKLIGADLATLEEQDYDRVLAECNGSLVNFFVRILIGETDEFDIRDKEKLQRFVQAYIDNAQVSEGKKEEVLFKNRGKIAKDILSQVQEKIKETTSIEYTITDKLVEFRPHWRTVQKGYVEKQKDAVVEEELTNNIIAGYRKTIFSRNVFESKQEKWLADILDKDKEILLWVRPPTGQMPITYKGGSYNVDFAVEAGGSRFYIIEVKARNEVGSEDVQSKAEAGIKWCEAMSKTTGQMWEYKLIPHDIIEPTKSFRGILSSAIAVR